jgi:hypothetical protein
MTWQLASQNSPILPLHAALLRTGKILFIAGSGNDPTNQNTPNGSAVWDYENDTFVQPTTPINPEGEPVDIFCAGHSFLSDGRLFVAGGTLQYDPFHGLPDALIFDPNTEQWNYNVEWMNYGRWYPTLITLGDGRIFAVSGLDVNGNLAVVPEIYDPSKDTWTKYKATSRLALYAHLFLLSNGKLFYSGACFGGNNGVSPRILTLPTDITQPITETPVSGLQDINYSNQAASVLLPPAQDQKVLILGGGSNGTATKRVNIVNLNATTPTYTAAPPLNFARMHHNAVILPDRTVFVCNGSGAEENGTKAARTAEIYNPATNTWTVVQTATVVRLYHSVALLLPDGRVATGGGNPLRVNESGGYNELRLEIYSPAYTSQTRPVIQNAPTVLNYGGTFTIETPQATDIKWVSLIKPMATTHGLDTDQRLVDVPINSRTSTSLTVQLTTNPNLAPPSWYMLFITDNAGIPSIATWLQVGVPNPQPQVTVYLNQNFGGVSQSFPIGIFRANRGDLNVIGNDTISSIKVPAGLVARFCKNETGGDCVQYGPGDYPNIGTALNDKISFIEVRSTSDRLQVTAASERNLTGNTQSFPIGTYKANQGGLNIVGNDKISSLRVPVGLIARVCTNADGTGVCREFTAGTYVYVGDDLNDKISFIEVRAN